ncbi:MAG: hypothetical protein IH851_09955 [Armatimonadetes bacterium]|nr:hypothetical protein [Armatimonadota bacterium]
MIAAAAAVLALTAPAFEARILWVDAGANLEWAVQPESVREFCLKAKASGFNELVVDVKPINGRILFHAPDDSLLREFKGVRVPEGYDLLQTFLQEGRAAQLRISACLNVFSEGHSYFPGVGLAYENPEWQTQVAVPRYTAVLGDGARMPLLPDGTPAPGTLVLSGGPGGFAVQGSTVRVSAHPEDAERVRRYGVARIESETALVAQTEAMPGTVAVFVDPLAPGVRERMLRLIERVARYGVDGIVLDRMRFSALESGMGPAMRDEFRRRYGPLSFWPESVFYADADPSKGLQRGPRFADWMRFRAEITTEFLRDVRETLRSVDARMQLGAYVGAGWETYYQLGVNYSADSPRAPYTWADAEYGLAGYAGRLDFLLPGCFYPVPREIDATIQGRIERFTVEGAAALMVALSGSATLVYPAIYGLDWENNPEGLRHAIRAARERGKGIMVFDAVYVIRNDWWELFAEEFKNAPPLPPHALPTYPRRTVFNSARGR